MSSETRTIRPYRGVDHFQGVLDRAQLYVGDRPIDGGSRVSLTADEYLNYPITLRLAADEHDRHENEGRIADGLGDLALATSDVELVVLTSAPRLKMVDEVFAKRLDELQEIPAVVDFPRERPRALRGPVGGCDIRVYFCLARQFPPRALHPWRKGTWLGKQEFQLRTDLGGVGFTPVRLTDELRGELGLDPQVTKYARVDPEVSVFDAEVPADAVSVYIDEGLLDRLAVVANSPIGKQLQRQLFLDAVWAIAMRAIAEISADDGLGHADVDEFDGSLVHGVVEMVGGRTKDSAGARSRNDRYRQLVEDPARFLSNLESRLASRRDVMDLFED
jgi:hypothetical protein